MRALLVASAALVAHALLPSPSLSPCRTLSRGTVMRPRMMMGAAAPAPAKTRTTTETKAPVRQQTRKVEKKREYAPPEEAPRYEVILLDDEEYEEGHIVNNLVRIIPGIESNKAKQVYLETKKVGQSLVLVCLEEHAEAYVDLLSRQEPMIFAEKRKAAGHQ